jgi:hypothetical protein
MINTRLIVADPSFPKSQKWKNRWLCRVCSPNNIANPRHYDTKKQAREHYNIDHNHLRRECGSCETSHKRMCTHLRHQKLHDHSGLKYLCALCNVLCDNEAEFDRHRISTHHVPVFSVKKIRVLVSEILFFEKTKTTQRTIVSFRPIITNVRREIAKSFF